MLRGVNGSGGGAPVGGSGTSSPSTIPRWTGASTLGDSIITQTGSTRITVGSGAYAGASVDGFRVANGTDSYIAASDGTRTLLMGANGAQVLVGSLTNHSLVVKTNNIDAMTILPGAAGVGGNVGIGTASPAARIHSVAADGTYQLALAGTTKGIRFQTTAAQSQIDGVDSTLVGSYQPLAINGSTLGFLIGGVTKAGINGSSQLYVSTNGTAASPVICESTGVSGMYFPSATTVAIAANGAIAATFSKVAGAGVALGGTTGLVFDASGTQQGLKLPATPGNADTQTLDAYKENTTWAPTVTWGTGGTVTTTSATGAYTQIGNVVTFTVTIAYNCSVIPTGGSITMDLPRTSATGFNQRPGLWAFNAWNGVAGSNFLSIGSASTTATLRVANATGTADIATYLTVTASGALVVTATYIAS